MKLRKWCEYGVATKSHTVFTNNVHDCVALVATSTEQKKSVLMHIDSHTTTEHITEVFKKELSHANMHNVSIKYQGAAYYDVANNFAGKNSRQNVNNVNTALSTLGITNITQKEIGLGDAYLSNTDISVDYQGKIYKDQTINETNPYNSHLMLNKQWLDYRINRYSRNDLLPLRCAVDETGDMRLTKREVLAILKRGIEKKYLASYKSTITRLAESKNFQTFCNNQNDPKLQRKIERFWEIAYKNTKK